MNQRMCRDFIEMQKGQVVGECDRYRKYLVK